MIYIIFYRLAEKAWNEKKERTAKDILGQISDLLEDLGPVEPLEGALEQEWETDEEDMEQ